MNAVPGIWRVTSEMARARSWWTVYKWRGPNIVDYVADARGNPRKFRTEAGARAALAKVEAT